MALAKLERAAPGDEGLSLYQHVYTHTHFGVKEAAICAPRPPHDGATAAWVGVSTPDATQWLQAGVLADRSGDHLYVETGAPRRLYDVAPASPGSCFTIGILRTRGGVYRLTLNGRVLSPRKRLPADAVALSTQERLTAVG